MIIVIDAYNILKNISRKSLITHQERLAFIATIARYNKNKKHTIHLIFDGGCDGAYPHYSNMRVIFSGNTKTADDIIQDLIVSLPADDSLVVTSDRHLVDYAHSHSIVSLDSLVFYRFITHPAFAKASAGKHEISKKYTPLMLSGVEACSASSFDKLRMSEIDKLGMSELERLKINEEVDQLMEESPIFIKDEDKPSSTHHQQRSLTRSKIEKKIDHILKKL